MEKLETLSTDGGKCKMWKSEWQCLKKLKIEYDPAIPLSNIFTKEVKTGSQVFEHPYSS